MKKLVIALAIIATVAVQAAEFKFPGLTCTNVSLLQEQLLLAPTDDQKIMVTYTLDFAQNGAPSTFAEACSRIDTAITAINPEIKPEHKINLKKQYGLYEGRWFADGWQYCKANPTSYDMHYLVTLTPVQLGETADAYCELVYTKLVAGMKDPIHVAKLVKTYCFQLVFSGITRPERFAKLQMLNDIYTEKLIEDKVAWGGVIAQIRTVMELYK